MLVPVLLFALGFVLLIKGGDWFVDGATGLARRFRVPEVLIGATVVSIGTTLPEAMVSVTSALNGLGAMSYGNAIGSIICNTSLIAAVTIAIHPPHIEKKSLRLPFVFFFCAAALYMTVSYTTRYFTRAVGLILLVIFVLYMALTVRQVRRDSRDEPPDVDTTPPVKLWRDLLSLAAGAAFIAVGADLLVDNGTIIAAALGVPDSVIALTVVALGTSLPELITAITSLVRGHGALSLGNIIGANLFNLVWVSGLSVALAPFEIPASKRIAGMNASLVVDLPVMLLVMGIIAIPTMLRGKLSRAQGIVLLVIYAAFCTFQFLF